MRIFFFLGQTFFEQSIGIAREIKSKYPECKFGAIVAARSNLIDELDKIEDPKFERYDWLSGLEKQWLDTKLDKDKLMKYQDMLGTESLRRIITADRELGVGFVSCGKVERTDLINMTFHNNDARWSYVVGLLDYYFAIFEKERPNIAFAYCVAGAVAFAMAEVCRYLDIKFVQPIFARVGNYYILDDNIKGLLTIVKKEFEIAKKNPQAIASYIPEAVKYLENFRNKPDVPDYSKRLLLELMESSSYVGLLKTLTVDFARLVAIKLGLKGTKNVLRQRHGLEIVKFNFSAFRNLRKTLQNKIDLFYKGNIDSPYIYYALHVDPEATTMVLADIYTDQMYVIETIAKTMPVGMKLVVKEHIPCIGRRPKGFYERISSMPDVYLVSPFTDSMNWIKNSSLVCSIVGTVMWEAILLGKSTLIIGEVHFSTLGEGFVYCPEITKLGEAISKAMVTTRVSEDILIAYIASIMKNGVDISTDDIWYEKHVISTKREKAIKEMANTLIKDYLVT